MKERLIGAAVLVALGVWLIPLLLDGPNDAVEDAPVSLQLPIPDVQNAEVRTEVIDLDGSDSSSGNAAGRAAPARDSRPSGAGSASAAETARGTSFGDASEATASARDVAPPADRDHESTAAANDHDASAADDAEESTQVSAAAARAAASSNDTPEPPAAEFDARAAADAAPSKGQSTPAGDWAIQLGSFGDEANARRLAERVTSFGYTPRIVDFRAGGRTMYRVRVGPHETRGAAEAAASALKAHGFVAQVVTAD